MKKLLSKALCLLLIVGTSLVLAVPAFARTRNADDLDQLVLTRNEALELLGALENVLLKAPRPDAPNPFDPAIPPCGLNCGDFDALARCVCLIKDRLSIICSKLDSCCENLSSLIEDLEVDIESCCAELNSRLDIVINIENSIVNSLESCCAGLNSRLDILILSSSVSIIPIIESCCAELNSRLDVIESSLDSCCDKIGELSDSGSCLPSLIDVPEDINSLNLNVIELLKTILLDLRGCGCNCP